MNFLAPLFFTALAALAVPVLIHLIQREKKQVVFFPSLMFLDKIPYKSVQRRRIHNWALLLLRAAAIALIIAAFARPFFNQSTLASAVAVGAREVVIMLDRSYSMGYGDRWARAQAAARNAIDGLVAGDRASLVFFARGADVDARSTDDRARLRLSVDRATVSAESTRYAPALKVAESVLQQSQLPRREIVLISDFQRAGWDGSSDTRLPSGTVVTPVPIGDATTSNVAVSSVALQRDDVSGLPRVTIVAGLQNRGILDVERLSVTLDIDDLEVQTQQVSLEGQASGSATFESIVLPATQARARVRVSDNGLEADDAFHFTLSRGQPIRVLVVERAGAGRDLSFYLQGALSIGRDPGFTVEVKGVDRLAADDLANRAVVILNDVPLGGGLTARFQRFVEQGGGLFVVLGDRSTWPDGLAIMPGRIAPTVDRGLGRATTIAFTDFSHPVFEIFRAPRSGTFGSTQVFRYRGVELAPEARVLARFDDGGVAMVEHDTGAGRVLVWTSTLDDLWSDLVKKPVFLPFAQQAVRYLARYEPPTPWLTVGQVFAERSTGRTRVAVTPSGERIPVSRAGAPVTEAAPPAADGDTGPGAGAAPSNPNTDVWVELSEPGFYEIRDAAGGGNESATAIAVNVDTAESDLTPIDPQELVAAMTGRAGDGGLADEAQVVLRPIDLERQQSVWWYLLLAGVLLLAGETWLANRLSRATS
jgi:hypothetical protein